MSKLTSRRVNGIKYGYWSVAKKDELIDKLGPIEEKAETLAGKICDTVCSHRQHETDQHILEKICEHCPTSALMDLIK